MPVFLFVDAVECESITISDHEFPLQYAPNSYTAIESTGVRERPALTDKCASLRQSGLDYSSSTGICSINFWLGGNAGAAQ